jgi:predicted nucleotidyltransferase
MPGSSTDEMREARATPAGVAFLLRRTEERRARAARRAGGVRCQLPAAVTLLVERFGATRVVLFGSLLRGRLDDWSDVDLAVAGVAPADHFRAAAAIETLLDATVDLVRCEEAPPSLLARLDEEGSGWRDARGVTRRRRSSPRHRQVLRVTATRPGCPSW